MYVHLRFRSVCQIQLYLLPGRYYRTQDKMCRVYRLRLMSTGRPMTD